MSKHRWDQLGHEHEHEHEREHEHEHEHKHENENENENGHARMIVLGRVRVLQGLWTSRKRVLRRNGSKRWSRVWLVYVHAERGRKTKKERERETEI